EAERRLWQMLRFWNNELLDNREGVHAAIADALHHATPTPTLPHRGGGLEATTTNPADPAQLIADLQRRLAECRAERDAARTFPPPRWGRVGVGVMPRTDRW